MKFVINIKFNLQTVFCLHFFFVSVDWANLMNVHTQKIRSKRSERKQMK